MTDSEHPAPRRRPRNRLRIAVLAAGVVAVVLVYVLVNLLYGLSGRVSSASAPDPRQGGVVVELVPRSVDANGEAISMQLELTPGPEYLNSDGVTLRKAITLVVNPVSGNQTVEFPAGAIPATKTIDMITPGAVENWPFDTYPQPDFVIAAFLTDDGFTDPLRTDVTVSGYLPGWNLTPTEVLAPSPHVDFSASRSWSTLAFGVLLLGLMVMIAGLVLYVSTSVYRGKRKVEASFMSWMGAMLFATIPLRGFLPGSPPIGSWIDYLIVLWVIVALVTGLGIYVAAWKRWGSPADPPPAPALPNSPAPAPPSAPAIDA